MGVYGVNQEAYRNLVAYSMKPEAQEHTIAYLAEHLGRFLKKRERVLICFMEHKLGNLSWLMEQAVMRCDAVPVLWGPDHRWKTLMQQAFFSKATAIIGPPLVILGLTKLIKYHATPLYIRKVITAGYPCLDWMIDGIMNGLDCEAGGCFTLDESGVVAGFACGHSKGIHLRREEYGVDIVDGAGDPLPAGQLGEIVLYDRSHPETRFPMGEAARMLTDPCKCGCESVRLVDMQPLEGDRSDMIALGQMLHSWTSILDCRISRAECGLEIEIVCFPGEKLPKLPSAARLILRPWNPKNDEPFWAYNTRKAVQESW